MRLTLLDAVDTYMGGFLFHSRCLETTYVSLFQVDTHTSCYYMHVYKNGGNKHCYC